MSNADFCCAENFPVLIPYRDLVKIVEVAKNLERYEKCLSRTNEQLVALRSQYTELCEKVREMDKLLCLPSPSPLSVSQRTQKHYFVAFVLCRLRDSPKTLFLPFPHFQLFDAK